MRLSFLIESKIDIKYLYLINIISNYLFSLDFSFVYKLKPEYLLPFSYSVSTIKNYNQNSKRKFLIDFSTIDYKLGVYLYNFLLEFSKESKELKLIWTDIKKEKKIKNDFCIFRTLSPVILDIVDQNWYLNSDLDVIFKQTNGFINEISYNYLSKKVENINFKFIELNKLVVKFDNQIFQGFNGIFQINSDPAILNLIYKIGLGFNKHCGFGMIEVINKENKEE